MLKIFKKRTNVFLQLILRQATLTLEGMQLLESYINQPDEKVANALTAKEKEADEARRILIDELNRSFITPFDREDLFAISRTVDDVLDYAYSTVTEIIVFKVTPSAYMGRMAALLREAAEELLRAVEQLQEHPNVSAEHARRAKKLENRVEDIYREALADLFKDSDDPAHLVNILKQREIYRHLSNAADRGDEAANIIADIVVKMA